MSQRLLVLASGNAGKLKELTAMLEPRGWSVRPQSDWSVPEAVEAISRGEVVIVVDAEDRENEGDFICAAEKATPEVINFMMSLAIV